MQSELLLKAKKLRDTNKGITELDGYMIELEKMQRRIVYIKKVLAMMRGVKNNEE